MATPGRVWCTMVEAWILVPEHQIFQDIDRFGSALIAIIATKGVYVEDCDLRNGHRKLMQRLVGEGATMPGVEGRTVTERLRKGLELAKASWVGLTVKDEAGTADGRVLG